MSPASLSLPITNVGAGPAFVVLMIARLPQQSHQETKRDRVYYLQVWKSQGTCGVTPPQLGGREKEGGFGSGVLLLLGLKLGA